MCSSRHATHELVNFLAGFAGADRFPLSNGGALAEMVDGLQHEENWFLDQLALPVPHHPDVRAVHLLADDAAQLYLGSDGKFLLVEGSHTRQIYESEAADRFGAIACAQALSNRILERIDHYLQIAKLWEDTLTQVKERIGN